MNYSRLMSLTLLLLSLGILLPVVLPNDSIPIHIHVEYTSESTACIQCFVRKRPNADASYHLFLNNSGEAKPSANATCKDVTEPLHVRCHEHGRNQRDRWIDTYVSPKQNHHDIIAGSIEQCYPNDSGEVCWIFHVYNDGAPNCNVSRSDTARIIGTVTTFLPPLLSDDKFNSTNKTELLESLELMRTSMFGNLKCARITGTMTVKGKELTPTSCVPMETSKSHPITSNPSVPSKTDPIYELIGDNPKYVTASFSLLIALTVALLITICLLCAICIYFCRRHRYKFKYEIENLPYNEE